MKGVGICKKRLEGSAGFVWNRGGRRHGASILDDGTGIVLSDPERRLGLLRVYTGQDYYNVGFLDTVTRIHVGATFNQTDFFRFRRRTS